MRLKRPHRVSREEVRITREGDTAVFEYVDPSIRSVGLKIGPELATMTDTEVFERFDEMLETRDEFMAGVDRTLTEIPPGRPQIEYDEFFGQWSLRGQVLRCHIADDGERGTVFCIDDEELDMAAFGRMLTTFSGFGMRIALVDEDDVEYRPEIVVREPDSG